MCTMHPVKSASNLFHNAEMTLQLLTRSSWNVVHGSLDNRCFSNADARMWRDTSCLSLCGDVPKHRQKPFEV